MITLLAVPDRENLRFFRLTTHLVSLVGAIFALNSIVLCAYSMTARGPKHSKHAAASSRYDIATAQKLQPIRVGFLGA